MQWEWQLSESNGEEFRMGVGAGHWGPSEQCPNLPERVDHLGMAQLQALVQQVVVA